jgi:beta-lactamase class A
MVSVVSTTGEFSRRRIPVERKTKSRYKRRPLPPGQRLLRYMALAAVVAAIQSESIPAGPPGEKAHAMIIPQVMVPPPFELQNRLADLEKQLKQETAKPNLRAGIFAIEPKTGRFVDLAGREPYCAASIIKLPILVSLLIALDKQELQPDQLLTIRKDLVGGGSGSLQWRPIGTKVPLKEAARLMIVFSDNTATNLIIEALGGKEKLNKQFADWGMSQTTLNDWLPDLAGTNKTSPYDLGFLLGKIEQGSLISKENRDYMYGIMEKTTIRTLLPQGLPPGARIAHKTGDIGKMVGDAGIITTPDGRRYLVAVQVERPHNDRRANAMIRDLSKVLYTGITTTSSEVEP